MTRFQKLQRLACLATTALLFGCSTYHRNPLPAAPDLSTAESLTVPVSKLDLPGLKPHPFSPTNGFDETTIMALAVVNNPDLKAARLKTGVARAQVIEAGLLPDPVASGGISRSTMHTGYDIGLSEDIQALITRGPAKAAAQSHERDVNLEILWQEWQVAEKARELFIQISMDNELHGLLTTNRDLLAKVFHEDQIQLQRNNTTAPAVTADLMALTDADTQLRDLETQANENSHALNQLLGLKPDAEIQLAGRIAITLLSSEVFHQALAALPHRRPDLLALQAGYESQEETLRKAVLAQFPAMSAGVQQSRDPVEGINSVGLTVNLTLPLFNRNRGQIAIERATRAQLYQEYQARLDQAVSEADQVWNAAQILSRQLHDLDDGLSVLEQSSAGAERFFQSGNLAREQYVTLESALLTQRVNKIRLRAKLEQASSALNTLICLPFSAGSDSGVAY